MKQVLNKLQNAWQRILGTALIALGFSACNMPFAAMYGTPYVDYTIKGKITDESDKPLNSAKVIVRNLGYQKNNLEYGDDIYNTPFLNDTLKVSENGDYIYKNAGGFDENDYRIIVIEKNHKPDSVELTLKFTEEDRVDDKTNSWLEGAVEETVNFSLKKY